MLHTWILVLFTGQNCWKGLAVLRRGGGSFNARLARRLITSPHLSQGLDGKKGGESLFAAEVG
jgi:hypothetical protein